MNRVYSIGPSQETSPLTRVYCKNEEQELQNLLERNLNLIPGDQIDPDDPPRWLLLKRELSVEDPETGEGRWSLDFLLVDHAGILTLVECKRFRDTRAKREVIGQMFDYAANASFYLNREKIIEFLEGRAQKERSTAQALVSQLAPRNGDSIDSFVESIENNIREGQLRLVFFMEEAPQTLRSIVEFLNKQMERTAVLLIEAKQFEQNGARIVVPSLWGYTEQARRVKKVVTVRRLADRRLWDYDQFRGDLEKRLDAGLAKSVLSFYEFLNSLEGMQLRWGTGTDRGSFSAVDSRLAQRSMFSVFSDGELRLNFQWLRHSQQELMLRNQLFEQLAELPLGLTPKDRECFVNVPAQTWIPATDKIQQVLTNIRKEFPFKINNPRSTRPAKGKVKKAEVKIKH